MSKGADKTREDIPRGRHTEGQGGAQPFPCSPALRCLRTPWTFHQVAVVSKYLAHPSIVSILGATTEPLELISNWMPGGDLPEYIARRPDADRLSLARSLSTALLDDLTPSPAVRCR